MIKIGKNHEKTLNQTVAWGMAKIIQIRQGESLICAGGDWLGVLHWIGWRWIWNFGGDSPRHFFHQIFRNWYFLSSFCSALDNDWAPRMPIWWFWWIITSSESIVAGWKDLESVLLLCQCHSFPMFLPLCDSQGSGSTKGSEPKSHSTIRPCLWGMNIHCTTYFVLRHRVLAPSRMVCRLLTTHCWNWIRLQHVGQVKKNPAYLEGFLVYSVSLATGDLAKSLDYFIVNVPLSKSLHIGEPWNMAADREPGVTVNIHKNSLIRP